MMKTFIAVPLILHLSIRSSFAFLKPQPQKTNVEVQVRRSKPFVNVAGQLEALEMTTNHNSITLKKEDRYAELLNMGLARKKKENRNA